MRAIALRRSATPSNALCVWVLFTDAMPDGSQLVRRDGFTAEWRTPPDPASSRAAEPDVRDEDVLFEADRPATVHRDAKADCDGRCS